MGKFNTFAFYTVILLAFIGLILSASALHEYVHMIHYKGIANEGDEICLLSTEVRGIYTFEYNLEDEERVKEIHEYSEREAHLLTLVYIIPLTILITYSIIYRKNGTN
jgi:uncharacterized membrane protein